MKKEIFRANNIFRFAGIGVAVLGLFLPVRQLDFHWFGMDSTSLFVGIGIAMFAGPTLRELTGLLTRGGKAE